MSFNQTPSPLDAQPHTPEDIRLLFDLYLKKRVEGQLAFYENRSRENALNSDFTFTVGTFIMTLSSLLATIGASAAIPLLALISAILPAFSALLAAFRQLYGWDRQSAIYRDAVLGLEKLLLLVPDDDRLPYSDVTEVFSKIIMSSEAVFTAEVGQWGQIVLAAQQEERDSQAKDPLARLIASANLSPDQMNAIQSIVSAGQTGVSLSSITTTTTDVTLAQPAADLPLSDEPVMIGQFTTLTETTVTAEAPADLQPITDDLIPPQETLSFPGETAAFDTPVNDDDRPPHETLLAANGAAGFDTPVEESPNGTTPETEVPSHG